uniref:3'-5' exonuclease domain-containing protein n=1 Tax=Panagrolaimus sp. ES5 TaxID=591445 RepID=A0AC34FDV1_9BILA
MLQNEDLIYQFSNMMDYDIIPPFIPISRAENFDPSKTKVFFIDENNINYGVRLLEKALPYVVGIDVEKDVLKKSDEIDILSIAFDDKVLLLHKVKNEKLIKVIESLRDTKIAYFGGNDMSPFPLTQPRINVQSFFNNQSLSSAYEKCFGKRIDKSHTFSPWANDTLSNDQISYAVIDALAVLRIFAYLKQKSHFYL